MNFQSIQFNQATTQKIYDNYIQQIEEIVDTLPAAEQLDILMEINSYIYEGMRDCDSRNELNHLQHIISNFGDLPSVLMPIVAERKLEQATTTFNPLHVFKAIALNIQNGIFFIFISILYIGLGFFGIAILAKLFSPEAIGMYYKPDAYFVLAGVPGDVVNQQEYELLGDWYIPIMLFAMFSFYVLITWILRFEKYLRKREKLKMNYSIG